MDKSHQEYRKRRVKRLKRLIVFTLLTAIIVPLVSCVILLFRVMSLEQTIGRLEETLASFTAAEKEENVIVEQEVAESVEWEAIEPEAEIQEETAKRKVYLTFDDGPSAYTEEILDILDTYEVKATFFVTGENAKSHPERYVEIVNRGHSLGMHSYSHKYGEIYASKEAFAEDFYELRDFLKETTGTEPDIYRFPGGSSNTVSDVDMKVFCDFLEEEGISYFDWNISSKDANRGTASPEAIYHNVVDDLERFDNAVVLMHDSVKKHTTVEALPQIIEYILAMEDTEILPITGDTVIVHHK